MQRRSEEFNYEQTVGGKKMQGYDVLMVYNTRMDRHLMCKPVKNPCKGLSQWVGENIANGEIGIEAAYGELLEEPHIPKGDMDFKYYLTDYYVEVYVGT